MNTEQQETTATPGQDTPRRSRLTRWVPWLIYAAVIVLLGCLLLSALLSMAPDAVLQVRAWVRKASYVGAMVQVLVCIAVISSWRWLVDWALRRGIVRRQEYRQVLELRWHAAAALAAYLLLIPIGISNLAMFFQALFP